MFKKEKVVVDRRDAPAEYVERSDVTSSGYFVGMRTRLNDRIARIVLSLVLIVSAIILIRFALLLTGANPANEFYSFMMRLSHPLLHPFLTLFGETPSSLSGVVEWTDVVALAVYWILALVILNLTAAIIHPTHRGSAYERRVSSQTTSTV